MTPVQPASPDCRARRRGQRYVCDCGHGRDEGAPAIAGTPSFGSDTTDHAVSVSCMARYRLDQLLPSMLTCRPALTTTGSPAGLVSVQLDTGAGQLLSGGPPVVVLGLPV